MGTERESITKEVGSRIRYARKSRGMSMDELAQAIYKTRSAISKYENGQISVDIATLYDIANALKISIYDLLHRNTPDINQEYNAEVPAFFRGVSQLYYICISSMAGSTAPNALLSTYFLRRKATRPKSSCT